MNNLFEDISDLDRAMGRFNLRKIFLAVRTLSTDLFGGAKSVITALPQDSAIGYALFSTGDAFDTRTEAAGRVEAYLYKGPMWHGALHENHIVGMRSISIIQRVGTELPPIGKTLVLVEDEGLGSEKEQYVRVIDVEAVEQTFTDNQGDYVRWIVRLDLSDPLRFDFDGHTPNRYDIYSYSGKARLRNSTVADATRYYGSQLLAQPAAIGDLAVKAESMFAQLVPSAQTETPLVNQPTNPDMVQTIVAGSRTVEVAQQAHTFASDVTAENRRFNWAVRLLPVPGPDALTVTYMAQGNWYTLRDGGDGTLSGSDPSIGAGTIDYTTGDVAVTLGALPDAGSEVIYTWASPAVYTRRDGAAATVSAAAAHVRASLEKSNIAPETFVVRWTRGGVEQSATTDAMGVVTGAGMSGTLEPIEGTIDLAFTDPPDRNTAITCEYDWRDTGAGVADFTIYTSGTSTLTAPSTLPPNEIVAVVYLVERDDLGRVRGHGWAIARDDGAGNLVVTAGVFTGRTIGTVDYAAGVVMITGATRTISETYSRPTYETVTSGTSNNNPVWTDRVTGHESVTKSVTARIRKGAGTLTVKHLTSAATTPAAHTESLDLSAGGPGGGLEIDLTDTISSPIIPDSLEISVFGKIYQDRSGALVTDIDPTTGSGITAGSIDYESGIATLTYWDSGTSYSPSVTSMLTGFGNITATGVFMRTPLAPVAPESLQIICTAADGEQLTAIADQDGIITSEWINGAANYLFGTAWATFGKTVADASLTAEQKAESWYEAANVDGDGNIFMPRAVLTSTLRFNAVSYKFIPLDSTILGIDPVRLPSDGRVPIYRPGDVAMIMHSDTTAPAAIADGTEIATRPRVAWVRVLDAAGQPVTEGYSLDRATGTVTIDDATGITGPVTVQHTVGDLRLVTDVQISGDITLSRPLTHDYPAGSIIGSCLLHGDRRARVSEVWDEQTWSGDWLDYLDGDEASATLNVIDFPITVTNEGCDTDRWVLRCTNSSSNQWELLSQNRGLVWRGTYEPGGADIAPINPRTRVLDEMTGTYVGGTPYMTIPGHANGGGWSTGNIVRINTVGAIADLWIARAIQQSDEPAGDGADGAEIYALGNIDRP
jgi:hypothetical protein